MNKEEADKNLGGEGTESPRPAPPNCYQCKHRRELVGNAHSRCAHPSIGETVAVDELLAAMGVGFQNANTTKAARDLNVKGHLHGIRMGWFIWPFNFDPTWLQSCDGFEPKTQVAGELKGLNSNA